MIFAELEYDQSYYDVHEPLVALLGGHFSNIESGLQGDSYVWVLDDGQKVAVDTFTSMHHQVKSLKPSPLVNQVLAVLARQYQLRIFDPPESRRMMDRSNSDSSRHKAAAAQLYRAGAQQLIQAAVAARLNFGVSRLGKTSLVGESI